ncbi:uncharacterized protein K452DRAFT_32379 [Aplosporella prunicola CBS 121167]|uniref:Uncharacterized protein n=1 Tax=Aplosporella prunicola CBS 121167 TaxID=1176127 RepID=A0A6A6BFK0_9PEZI|nr:uncharacterized protein K452DRAFT_32379 [Aplosporella prunicola CBS 121167]KAF2141697.1 hypothetical protein K452DRAFT_32379 [Aplosporella prunicola CBS 121167]
MLAGCVEARRSALRPAGLSAGRESEAVRRGERTCRIANNNGRNAQQMARGQEKHKAGASEREW